MGRLAPSVICVIAAGLCSLAADATTAGAVVPEIVCNNATNATAAGVVRYNFTNRGRNSIKVTLCQHAPSANAVDWCGVKDTCVHQVSHNSSAVLLASNTSTYLYAEFCEADVGSCGSEPLTFYSYLQSDKVWNPPLITPLWDKYACETDDDCGRIYPPLPHPGNYFCRPREPATPMPVPNASFCTGTQPARACARVAATLIFACVQSARAARCRAAGTAPARRSLWATSASARATRGSRRQTAAAPCLCRATPRARW